MPWPSLILLLVSLPSENRRGKDPCQFEFFKYFDWNYSKASKALTVRFSFFPLKPKISCQSNKDSHLILTVGPELVKNHPKVNGIKAAKGGLWVGF